MPATDIDDGTLRHMLEQADGNVEQALRQIRQMTGDEELEDTGYKLDAGSNDVSRVYRWRFRTDCKLTKNKCTLHQAKTEALAANRAGSITPTLSTHITSPSTTAPATLPPATTAPAPPVSTETNADPQLAELKVSRTCFNSSRTRLKLDDDAGHVPYGRTCRHRGRSRDACR